MSDKVQKIMRIHNPNGLPTIDYRTVLPLQGQLKDLSTDNYAKLKGVLERRGFDIPLFLWRDGDIHYLLDGHQRQRVMTTEDMSDAGDYAVPYILVEANNEQDAKAKLLEITSQYGSITYEGWDAFTADLEETELLEAVHFDALPLLGTRTDEPEVEEDEAPEISSEPPVSLLGEVYQLGRHRLMCGDSTLGTDIEQLLDGAEPDMVYTDPPYGMNYSGRGKNTSTNIMNDNIDPTEFYNLGSHIAERYVWGRVENYKHLFDEPRDVIIWKKNNFGMGRGYRGQYEVCFYYGDFTGSDSDVWELPKDSKYDHPTQKPVSLAVRAIKNSKPQLIIDYFGGSGSTLIACEQTNRTCYMMELDPKYCDVIRKRYWKLMNDGEVEDWEAGTPVITG